MKVGRPMKAPSKAALRAGLAEACRVGIGALKLLEPNVDDSDEADAIARLRELLALSGESK